MKQFFGIKEKHPDALLLFRVGDFYETFSDDAVKASQILGITLTKRANGSASHVDLAGFPYHSLDTYLPKLIQAGIRVAICEQLEDPKATKTIVQRGVTELISPGTAINDKVLAFDSNNYLACIHFGKLNVGLSLLELSTGQFLMTEQTSESIKRIIEAYQPSEVLVAKSNLEKAEEFFESKFYTYQLEDYLFEKSYCYNNLINHFKTVNLKGFGIEDFNEGIISAGIILHYLNANKHEKLGHITNIQKIESTDYIWLDRFTIRNLELIESNHPDGKSLFSVINRTKSPMGNRLLKRWIMMPLKNLDEIHKRQSKTSAFVNNRELRKEIAEKISRIGDLERLIGKIALQKVTRRLWRENM
jgi:DNA mismatch repair protein MutS